MLRNDTMLFIVFISQYRRRPNAATCLDDPWLSVSSRLSLLQRLHWLRTIFVAFDPLSIFNLFPYLFYALIVLKLKFLPMKQQLFVINFKFSLIFSTRLSQKFVTIELGVWVKNKTFQLVVIKLFFVVLNFQCP